MSLARVFCSWSVAAVLLLLSITFSSSENSQTPTVSVDEGTGEEGNKTSNVTLTGNPQIDYIHDPNLPRELNGYNLSDYPFYHRVPPNINFSCDGRKDGFYASIEHKCQIYHHCLFSSRFDFICANYTAFDQRTFICQFVSDVDCPNSHMYYHRNDALYVAKSTTTIAPVFDREIYNRRRPPKKPKPRPRPEPEDAGDAQTDQRSTVAPAGGAVKEKDDAASQGKKKDAEYSEDDYYEDDYDYPRRARPAARRPYRKCRNGRRRGRRCRRRRPMPYYYDDDDYYEDDYDYAYYDDVRPRKPGSKKRRPLKAIPSETSPQVAESSSETPPSTSTRTTTTTTTTEPPPSSSSEMSMESGPLDSDAIAVLQSKRDELLYKTRRPSPNVRPPALRPSRQNDKPRFGSTTTTSTERAKPLTTTTTTTTTTTEVPQYIYDYEYYEDDTPMMDVPISSTTTTTTTQRPALFRGKTRLSNAAALLEKQRVVQQSSVQVRVTEDTVTNTNTIRRRDNSNVQTPTRVVTHSSTSSVPPPPPPTTPASRPARFWQRKSTVKSSSSTKAPTTTTTTLAPYYQDYQDYEDVADPQSSLPMAMSPSPQQQSSKFQPLLNPPQHQYGTTPVRQSSYVSNAAAAAAMVLPPQQSVTSSRGHSSYASRPNKHYAMQQQPHHQYSQSSSSTSSISSSNSNSNSNNNNYNTNSYHRQRSPQPQSVVPKPEFISLVDEDYNNPYMGGGAAPVGPVGPSSPPSTRLSGGGAPAGGPGYHHQQHPIRFFEQHGPPSFLFGAASEYNNPQLAFPPRNYPSPSNFQPYGHSTRRYSASSIFNK